MSQATDYSLANQAGAALRAELNSILAAIQTWNSGAAGPGNEAAHMFWMDTGTPAIHKRNAANNAWKPFWKIASDLPVPYVHDLPMDLKEQAIADADATPDVSAGIAFKTANTGATTITALDGALYAGELCILRIDDANTTIAGALTKTGRAIVCAADDYLVWQYDGAAWNQIDGSVGMGQFVPLADADVIGDWIASNVTTFTDVDVSDDGVRKGACAVAVRASFYDSTLSPVGLTTGQVRKNGSSATTNVMICGVGYGNIVGIMSTTFIVAVDDNAIFEAKFGVAFTTGVDTAAVVGYWI